MIKSITHIALTLSATVYTANAATTLATLDPFIYDSEMDQGTWTHQSLTLNDGGWISSGAPLSNPTQITSFELFRDNSTSVAGQIWMAALSIQGDLTSTVAVSSHTLDVNGTAQGGILAWNFAANSLDTGTQYFFTPILDDGDGMFETDGSDTATTVRVAVPGDIISGGAGGDTKDWAMRITAVPEPSSAALLGLGGLALILRRRK
ncbi:PEP-CTERM sorting domain-containing protein [Oceaniferula marina]|uniref:PEP-CTERM sorting domain-containing protein n=1 Tax=Oceaniferula marina TaxID=2748318 RepID=UPI0029C9F139|nr:PEP-CTERM sorting domain-containing protein [Oceaniferula marina]